MTTLNKVQKKPLDTVFMVALILFFALVAFDLITKAWAEYYFTNNPSKDFIPGFMRLTIIHNSGMGFSMADNNPVIMGVVIFITVPVVALLFGLMKKLSSHYNAARVLLSVVAAGATANFIDRVYYYVLNLANGNIPTWLSGGTFEYVGGVRDFMDLSPWQINLFGFTFDFGVCNFADYYLTVGGVLFLIVFLVAIITDKEDEQGKKAE